MDGHIPTSLPFHAYEISILAAVKFGQDATTISTISTPLFIELLVHQMSLCLSFYGID